MYLIPAVLSSNPCWVEFRNVDQIPLCFDIANFELVDWICQLRLEFLLIFRFQYIKHRFFREL